MSIRVKKIPLDDLSLRSVEPGDQAFLFALYKEGHEIKSLGLDFLPEEQKAVLLQFQFNARNTGYGQSFPDGKDELVLLGKEPIGRLFVGDLPQELRIVDIAVVPSFRGQGVGTYLINRVLLKAQAQAKTVSLHVYHDNPAARLYQQLGFVPNQSKSESDAMHLLMNWKPNPTKGKENGSLHRRN